MVPWVRSPEFLQGREYREEYSRYIRYIRSRINDRMLFLELGVGLMTPMFIKEPFMDMVCQLPNAIYAPVNPRHAFVPDEIADRSIPVDEDIRFTFRTMLGQDTAHLAREASVFNPSRAY